MSQAMRTGVLGHMQKVYSRSASDVDSLISVFTVR